MISCSFATWAKYGRICVGNNPENGSGNHEKLTGLEGSEGLKEFFDQQRTLKAANDGVKPEGTTASKKADTKEASRTASPEAAGALAKEELKRDGYHAVEVFPKLEFLDAAGKALPAETVRQFHFKPNDATQVEKGKNGQVLLNGFAVVNGERVAVKTDFALLKNFWAASPTEAKLFEKRDIVYEDHERYNHGRIYPGASLKISSNKEPITIAGGDKVDGADIWYRDLGDGRISVLFIEARGNERYWVTRGTASINDLPGNVTPPTMGQEVAIVDSGVLQTLKKNDRFSPVNLERLMPPVILPPEKKR